METITGIKNALDYIEANITEKLDYEQTYGSIVHDYPASAKKIVEVFDTCISPKIQELLEES